jgi:SET domain-containing protein
MKADLFIDISNSKESEPILLPKKHKSKLKNFNYIDNYTKTSFLEKGNMDDYLLTPDYTCECRESCELKCECISEHNQKYECNINCFCDVDCSNRTIQKGITKKLKIDYINSNKGFGVFTLEPIKSGEFICEYIGEIIGKQKALDRINENFVKNKPNYVLQLREHYEKIIINSFFDGEIYGNVSRFINHSCNPNLHFEPVRVDHFIPHVAFYALRDIEVGEELTFAYCDVEERRESFDKSCKKCECGAERCIKYLPS